jgi:lipoate-protein ligase B
MRCEDLGLMEYRQAWARQEATHAEVLAGGEERVLLVEHPPVITFGRRPGVDGNLIASSDQLARLGVDVVQSDRGGDITFHGPGQLVAYPIVRLNDHGLSVGAYVHGLEDAVIATLAEFGIVASKDRAAVGVWTDDSGRAAKICALGVRIKRGVSLHGLALNVETDLRYFDLIVPCGLTGRPVTSMRKIMGDAVPPMEQVKEVLRGQLDRMLSGVGRSCRRTESSVRSRPSIVPDSEPRV